MRDFTGKVAVVLGASAEAGSGWGIAEALAAAGAKVVVAARREAPLQKLAARIGGKAQVCDAGNEAQIAALARSALDHYGHLDFAINAAGTPVLGMIDDLSNANLQAALQVNYLGNVWFVREMARAIGQHGSIVLVTSLSTTHPVLPNVAYACAKAATDCLVKYAAIEYGARDIRVNSIQPGGIQSEMTQDLYRDPAVRAIFEKEVPLGRVAQPADLADAVLWLCGGAFTTGANLPIAGGNQLGRFPTLAEMGGGGETWQSANVENQDLRR